MTEKLIGMFDSFEGVAGVDPTVRAGHVDGSVEKDESLKSIGNDEVGALMRTDDGTAKKIMDEVTNNRADNSALDI